MRLAILSASFRGKSRKIGQPPILRGTNQEIGGLFLSFRHSQIGYQGELCDFSLLYAIF